MEISHSQYIPIYREDTIYICIYLPWNSIFSTEKIYTKCLNPKIHRDSIDLFPQFRWLQKKKLKEMLAGKKGVDHHHHHRHHDLNDFNDLSTFLQDSLVKCPLPPRMFQATSRRPHRSIRTRGATPCRAPFIRSSR